MSLRYDAPPDCPDVDRYSSHVRSRSTTLSVQPRADALDADDAVTVQVQPAAEPPGWLGHVSIAGPQALDREVRGARCEDVVAALALITVLRLEGGDAGAPEGSIAGTSLASNSGTGAGGAAGATARDGALSPPALPGTESVSSPSREAAAGQGEASARGQPEPSASNSAVIPPAASAPELTPEASRTEPSGAPTPTLDSSMPAPEGEVASDGRRTSTEDGDIARNDGAEAVRAGASEAAGPLAREPAIDSADPEGTSILADSSQPVVAPSWRWPSLSGAAVALRAGYASVPAHAFKAALEGELRLGEGWVSELSIAYARGKGEVEVAKLDLSLLTLDAGLCPLVLGADSRVWVRACAGLRAGALHLAIDPTQAGSSEASVWRPWASLGPSLRVGVPLSESWTLRGLAELAVQLVRDNFDVELTSADGSEARRFTVYRPEAISLELGLGVGYSF